MTRATFALLTALGLFVAMHMALPAGMGVWNHQPENYGNE